MVRIGVRQTIADHGFGVLLLVVAFAALLDGIDIGVALPIMRGSSSELITPIAVVVSAVIVITPFIAAVRASIIAPIITSVIETTRVVI